MSMASGYIIGVVKSKGAVKTKTMGARIMNFKVVAQTPRYDAASGSWVDGEPVTLRCNAWNAVAENADRSLSVGDHIVMVGRFHNNRFTDNSGTVHDLIDFEADSVGVDLRFHAVEVFSDSD